MQTIGSQSAELAKNLPSRWAFVVGLDGMGDVEAEVATFYAQGLPGDAE